MKIASLYISDLRSNTLPGYAYGTEGDTMPNNPDTPFNLAALRDLLDIGPVQAAIQLPIEQVPSEESVLAFSLPDGLYYGDHLALAVLLIKDANRNNGDAGMAGELSSRIVERVKSLLEDSSDSDRIFVAVGAADELERKLRIIVAYVMHGVLPFSGTVPAEEASPADTRDNLR